MLEQGEEVEGDMQAIYHLPKICIAAMELTLLKTKVVKVGDRVRVTGDCRLRGCVGTVTKIEGEEMNVKFLGDEDVET